MFWNDHPPPHFHARYGDYEITVEIDSGVVEGKFPPRSLAHILEWHRLHRDELRSVGLVPKCDTSSPDSPTGVN